MQLRHHPLMIHCDVANWPPKWQTNDQRKVSPVGEVGIVRLAKIFQSYPETCVLIMEHESRSYMGFLTFDDAAFCRQVCSLINENAGSSTTKIGDLDL